MIRAILTRTDSSDQGTFGTLRVPTAQGELVLRSGELPWRQNRRSGSCIPAGTYRCLWTTSAKFPAGTYELQAVPNRDGIRIHSANLMGDATKGYAAQVEGCIALGDRLGELGDQAAVLNSRTAVQRFETLMGRQPFDLELRDP